MTRRVEASSPRALITPAALHILMTLAEGVRHGYGIKREVEERTGGSLRLGPGTLYEAIHRMRKAGWIREARSAGGEAGARRAYRITSEGRRRMRVELERLEALIAHARAKALLSRS